MSETKFKPGDQVRLKSGGPTMTVDSELTAAGAPFQLRCVWFNKTFEHHAYFHPTSLVRADVVAGLASPELDRQSWVVTEKERDMTNPGKVQTRRHGW